MPSLFSRPRTISQSNPNPTAPTGFQSGAGRGADEFGRYPSSSGVSGGPPPTPRKDKDKDYSSSPFGKSLKKKEGHSGGREREPGAADEDAEAQIVFDSHGFYPITTLPYPPSDTTEVSYGHLAHRREIVISLDRCAELVDDVCAELATRGVQTPLLFSSLAIDLNVGAVRRLIDSFLGTFGGLGDVERARTKWNDDLRFGAVHELGMVLRWGMARVMRRGERRGLMDLDRYMAWRNIEEAQKYPPTSLSQLFASLPKPVMQILTTLLNLLSLLMSYSTTNGLTPAKLSSLFGPLVFGLGPASARGTWSDSYTLYLASANAFEHILLAFVRFSYTSSGMARAIPPKLEAWIRGYPRMIQSAEKLQSPRSGAKLVRAMAVRRNVRLYSSDVVRSCVGWAGLSREKAVSAQGGEVVNELTASREWGRIAGGPGQRLDVRYTDGFRKRMALPTGCQPSTISTRAPASPVRPSLAPTGSASRSTTTLNLEDNDEMRFKTLSDLKWGEFESAGFLSGDGGFKHGLEFDLNESARRARPNRGTSLSWNDFSQSGFLMPTGTTPDGKVEKAEWSLDGALQFDSKLVSGVDDNERAVEDIGRKLRKSAKNLPAFGWDTSPVASEELIEEGYISAFCDIIYGGGVGWMNRHERCFREGNWGLVELKSFPNGSTPSSPIASFPISPGGGHPADGRTGSTLLLFEEFVPAEYRAQLANPSKKSRFPATLTKQKKWKPATTLNGAPYVPGQVPTTTVLSLQRGREREKAFEGLLESHGRDATTLRLTLDGNKETVPINPPKRNANAVGGGIGTARGSQGITPLYIEGGSADDGEYPRKFDRAPTFPLMSELRDSSTTAGLAGLGAGGSGEAKIVENTTPRKSRFRLGRNKSQPVSPRSGRGLTLKDLDAVEFETRTTGSSSGEQSPEILSPGVAAARRDHKRRESKDDTWVDILVSSKGRAHGQDFDTQRRRSRTLSDPDRTREEVALALRELGTPPPDLPEPNAPSPPRRQDYLSQRKAESRRHGGIYDADSSSAGHGPASKFAEDDEDINEVEYVPHRMPPKALAHAEPHIPREHDDGLSDMEDETEEDEGANQQYDTPQQYSTPYQDFHDSPHQKPEKEIPGYPFPVISPQPQPQRGSGVSALIEMYRNRDKEGVNGNGGGGGSPNAKPMSSKLPVRAGSSKKEKEAPLPPPPPPEVEEEEELEGTDEAVEEDTMEPVQPGEEHGASPARYVHGAPLHNLPEEEEED